MTDAVIAEDEPLLRGELKDSLTRLWPGLRIVAEAEDGVEALDALGRCKPQVMFLDIEMPGLSGLEVARAASGRCHIVFVTAYNQHAVAAFEQGAVDYVMKPFSAARLAAAIARVRERLDAAPAKLDGLLEVLREQAPKRGFLRWINASSGQNVRLITTDEVCYFKADSKYTLVVTADAEALIRRSIKELMDELDPEVFWPVHRGVVVNVNAIALAHRKLGGQFELKLKQRKETLAVSEPFAYRFRQM
ncbi:LytR/AlgR family response regulator transcription factor [Rivibacter subsaxonicus]|uniref:LytTR family two component transcriptional regulator n=1 Tax=Rivibacter subsaxonicus TaxID=457575 RepID=A0A4V2FSP1_9BURK|nr:LytTR family DNA-binding domain-containing protein [Rivibacter subsaxonicus]RZT95015.1 LytTR family two component transcriptional regulator [Rivibacter subsaxonicus]